MLVARAAGPRITGILGVQAEEGGVMNIDTADTVVHGPSGERWLVAYVRGEYVAWCGWPQGEAKLTDCELVKKATTDEREKLLREMAGMNDEGDPRCRYASRK
jgi:hypothetical protein